MKTQENKQKAIELAYGDYYLEGSSIDENGWTDSISSEMLNTIPCDYKSLEIEYKRTSHFYRPKSLSAIEHNNNWISIRSKEDLPNNNGHYLVFNKHNNTIDIDYIHSDYDSHSERWMEFNSHYQPIEKPSKPLY